MSDTQDTEMTDGWLTTSRSGKCWCGAPATLWLSGGGGFALLRGVTIALCDAHGPDPCEIETEH